MLSSSADFSHIQDLLNTSFAEQNTPQDTSAPRSNLASSAAQLEDASSHTFQMLDMDHGATIAVIDGNSLMHRAFHAVREPMCAPDGRSTNALLGFFNMLIKLYRSFKPDGIICAFDKGKPQVRIDMLPQYKAQRPAMDPSLRQQFPMVKELLGSLRIPVVEQEGWEGDDILGTLARMGTEAGYHMLLFTGDRDMYQLASDTVSIVSTKKGVSDVAIMTPEDVDDLYHGITPDKVCDFYGLKGDTSDNIPGVPGIGPKRAAALIVEYGDLEGVIAHADEVAGKMGENLRAHIDDARLSKRVATIRTDAPIEIDFCCAVFPQFDPHELACAFLSLGFQTLTLKLIQLMPSIATSDARKIISACAHTMRVDAAQKAQENMSTSGRAVTSEATFTQLSDASENNSSDVVDVLPTNKSDSEIAQALAEAHTYLSSAFHTYKGIEGVEELRRACEADEVIGCSWCEQSPEAEAAPSLFELQSILDMWFATSRGCVYFKNNQAREMLVYLLEKHAHLVTGDIKELLHLVYPCDSSKRSDIDIASIGMHAMFDTQLAAYLLNSDATDYSAQTLLETYVHLTHDTYDELCACDEQPSDREALDGEKYAYEARAQKSLCGVLQAYLTQDESYDLYYDMELPLVAVLCYMERMGLAVSTHELRAQSQTLAHQIEELLSYLRKEAGEDINFDSPMQLSHVLFDVWELPTKGLKKTKRGYYSTNAKTLEKLSSQDERVQMILDYRACAKLKSTYLDALPTQVAQDGRIHTTFNQTIAATGRLSSSDPNLQNIPTRSDLGHAIRKAFKTPADTVFLTCDYSQIELRLLAHLSEDEHLIHAFKEGKDFHRATAARIFGIPEDEVDAHLRSRAKAVNFGIVYGQQAFGLATLLKISVRDAQEMIDKYFEAYPSVRVFLDKSVQFARDHGYVMTMYGRKRHIPNINANNFQVRSFAERTAMNHPMQGSAADIIKLAMLKVEEDIRSSDLRTKMVLQIHDELDFEVAKEDIEAVSALVKRDMEAVVDLRVPLIAEVSYASTWADAK